MSTIELMIAGKEGICLKVLLEFIRIILIFILLGGVLSHILQNMYLAIGSNTGKYSWLGFIAVLILFFVLYRNKLQFSGWYRGKGREKLPKRATQLLVLSAVVLIILPPILSTLLG